MSYCKTNFFKFCFLLNDNMINDNDKNIEWKFSLSIASSGNKANSGISKKLPWNFVQTESFQKFLGDGLVQKHSQVPKNWPLAINN